MRNSAMTRWSLLGLSALFSLALALLHFNRDAAQDEQEPDIRSAVSEVPEIQPESEIQFDPRVKVSIHPRDLYSKLIESPDYWSYSLRSRLLALPPSELLALLERDELLVRDDARDMIVDLASWCAGALMFAKENAQASEMGRELAFHDNRVFERMQKAFNGGWCGRFARAPDAHDRMKRLQELIDVSDLPGQDRYERVMTQVQEAAARNDGSLQAMISSDRADLISVAMYEIVQQRDSSVIVDWTTLDELSLNQVQSLLPHLRIGLECQQLGQCSARDNPAISAACFNTGLHCSTGTDFYSIMRRGLSPIQFEALTTLMNSVSTYRRGHGG